MKANRARKTAAEAPASKPFKDRPVPRPANRGRAQAPFTKAELAAWVQKAKDLPDIRWDRVQALRKAIASGEFDIEERLAHLDEKLPPELIEYFRQLSQKKA